MKIRAKLMAGFMAIAFIAIIIGATGYICISKFLAITNERQKLQAESASISSILNAHYVWRQNLTESVLAGREFTGSLDSHNCALGKWQDSDEAKKVNDPQLLAMLAQLNEPHEYIHNEAKDTIALIQRGNMAEAKEHLTKNILPKTYEVIAILENMQAQYATFVKAKDTDSVALGKLVLMIIVIFTLIALIVSCIIAFSISGMISGALAPFTKYMRKAAITGDLAFEQADMKVIDKYSKSKDELGQVISATSDFLNRVVSVSEALKKVADGDLTEDFIPLSDKDVLGLSVNTMTDNLNNMLGKIDVSTKQVSSGAKQIADGAQSLAQCSTEQASSIQQLSASIIEIAGKTKTNADMAGKAAHLADTIRGNAEKGSGQMDEMMSAVSDINQASQSINKVIKVIDDIAFQTNILALNAAVEAARAGQHGKGFAVVAEEVRNLAAKSADAAKETGSLIQNSIEKAEMGSRIASETAASLTDIVSGINESSQLIGEIAKSSQEQSLGIEQVHIGIDQVAQVVQQNSATAEESAASSQEMSGQSSMLEDLLSQFSFKGGGASGTSRRLTAHSATPLLEHSSFSPQGGAQGFGKY